MTSDGRRIKILYSAGLGRNGGTLLDRALGEIDGFHSLGEFRMVWRKGLLDNDLCNCGEAFRSCPFWRAVFDRAFRGMERVDASAMLRLADSVDRTRYLPLLMSHQRPARFQRRLEEYRSALAGLYESIHDVSGARVLVDSSRFAGTALILGSIPGFDLYVLHLIRDARASAFSWQRKKRRIEARDDVKFIKQYSPFQSSFWWLNRNLSVEMIRPLVGHYKRLLYEDFVASPKEGLEALVSFTDEVPQTLPVRGDRCIHLGPSHTQSGNPARFQTGDVEIRIDDEWRHSMRRNRRWLVTASTWPLLLRYGYLSSRHGATR